jgi:hypothetical protein
VSCRLRRMTGRQEAQASSALSSKYPQRRSAGSRETRGVLNCEVFGRTKPAMSQDISLDRGALYYPYVRHYEYQLVKTLLCFPNIGRMIPPDSYTGSKQSRKGQLPSSPIQKKKSAVNTTYVALGPVWCDPTRPEPKNTPPGGRQGFLMLTVGFHPAMLRLTMRELAISRPLRVRWEFSFRTAQRTGTSPRS